MEKSPIRDRHQNETWSYTRIRGALAILGHEVGRNTIKRILLENGIDPAPLRGKRMPWAKFIPAYFGSIATMDFFTSSPTAIRYTQHPSNEH
jgi:hypothetical protein